MSHGSQNPMKQGLQHATLSVQLNERHVLYTDPAAPWNEGGETLADAVGLEQAGPSTSPEPATSTAISGPLGMSDLNLEATAVGALRPSSAPARSQVRMEFPRPAQGNELITDCL